MQNGQMAQTHEAMQMDEVIQRIATSCPDITQADIERVVWTLHAGFDDAKLREFVPLLVERKARVVLSHRAHSLHWST